MRQDAPNHPLVLPIHKSKLWIDSRIFLRVRLRLRRTIGSRIAGRNCGINLAVDQVARYALRKRVAAPAHLAGDRLRPTRFNEY